MKRFLSLFLFAILFGGYAFAYNFSAVCSSGQTLYYLITSNTNPYTVQVVSENASSPYYTTYPTGDLIIPETVEYNSVTYSVTSIGNYAFQNCSGLISVTIPNSVTSIGSHAFYNCSGLTTITIGNSVTSIGSSAFNGCSELTSVYYTGNVEEWCRITFDNYDANPIYYAHNLYIDNSLVTDLVIPETITEIKDYAFRGATCLTSVTIPNCITSIGNSAFRECTGLTSITIPNSVTYIDEYAFFGNSALTEVDFPNSVASVGSCIFNGSNVPEPIYNSNCFVYFPNGYSTEYVIQNGIKQIAGAAFSGCSELTEVSIPNSVTNIGSSAFKNCSGLTEITIPNSVTYIGGWSFNNCRGLREISISNSVTNIDGYTFQNCSSLTSITIPNSITNIGDWAFDGCIGLSSLIIPDSVLSIGGGAFYGCNGLTEITIGRSVSNIKRTAFYNCSNLTTIYIKSSTPASVGNRQSFPDYSATLYVPCGTIESYSTADGWSNFSDIREHFPYTIDVASANSQQGTASITQQPNCNDGNAIITATSTDGYVFAQWNDGNTDNPRTLTVTQDTVFTAQFELARCLIASGTCGADGDNLTWTLSCDSLLTISGSGAMEDYSSTGAPWYGDYRSKIKTLVIDDGVTSIGGSAFENCSGLTSVTIGSGVTNIGADAFYGCSGLSSVYYKGDVAGWFEITFDSGTANPLYFAYNLYVNNELVTDLVIPQNVTTIKNYAFYNATCLTSITIPNSVTSIGEWAFRNCSELTSVNFNATNCTTMGSSGRSVFSGCASLSTLNIGENVTNIPNNAFQNCNGLTSVTIPNSVTSIGNSAFFGCSGLTTVNFNATNCTSMGLSVWSGCSSLSTLNIGENVTNIPKYAFQNCNGLTSVTIPNSVMSIGQGAFLDCSGLTTVTIGNSVTNILGSFNNCSGLNTINFNATNCTSMYSVWSGCSSLSTLNIGENVTNIPNNAFQNCNGLTSVTIPNSVTSIGVESFSGCSGLTTVNFNATNCTTMGSSGALLVFNNCTSLSTLNIGENVTNIPAYAFSGCNGLTFVTIPNSVTSIGNYAFQNCSGLTTITIPDSVASIGSYAFSGCSGLEDVRYNARNAQGGTSSSFPSNLHLIYLGDSVESIGNYMFYECTFLDSIVSAAVNPPAMNARTFYFVNIPNVPVIVPCRCVAAYEGADYWNNFNTVRQAFGCIQEYTITVVSANPDFGSVSGGGTYDEGTEIAISATPSAHSHFVQWNDGNTDNPRTITVTADATYIAEFAIDQHTITLLSANGSMGTVSEDGTYDYGNEVEISATSSEHHHFVSWSDGNTENPRTITVTEDVMYIATFAIDQFAITVLTSNYAMGTVNGGGTYNYGTERQISAIPTEQYQFVQWNDGNTDNPRTITVTENATFTAEFDVQHTIRYNATAEATGNWVVNNTNTSRNTWDRNTGDGVLYLNHGVTSIGGGSSTDYSPFNNNTDLVTVDLDNSGLTSIGYSAFSGSSELTSVTIPNSVTSIGNYAFINCSGLTSIIIGNSVTSLGERAFQNCIELMSVTIPGSVTSIGWAAFYSCSNLAAVYYTGDITQWCGITFGDYWGSNPLAYAHKLYVNNELLTNLEIPETVTEIKNYAFYSCNSLTSVTIPNSVTSIGRSAFYNCSRLSPITIGNSVASIGEGAFAGCYIYDIYANPTTPPSASAEIFTSYGYTATLWVPCGSAEAYRTADIWSNFSNINERGTYNLDVSSANPQQGSASITQQPNCTDGTAIIAATPNSGYAFTQWSDGNADNPRTITVTEDVAYSANFGTLYQISVVSSDESMGSASGSGMYAEGSQTSISATPAAHYHFVQWNDGNAENPRTITVITDATYTAEFGINQLTVNVSANNSDMGTANGGGIYDYGTERMIWATPEAHYHFVQWSDGNTTNPRTISVTADTTFTAEFAIDEFTITVFSNNSSLGSVSGSGTYDYGASRQISASPSAHYHFVQWNDGNTTNPRTINVTADAIYTAEFAIDQFTITVSSADESKGTVSGGGTYDYGMIRQISATANAGYRFVAWNDGNADNPRNIAISDNATYVASFEEAITYYTITLISANTSQGSVAGNGTYAEGTETSISATPSEHHHFVSWNDGNTDNPRIITVTEDAMYIATFAIDQFTIAVSANDYVMGTVSGTGTYNYGTERQISAAPSAHYHFVSWNDGNTDNPRTITVTQNVAYTARFAIDQHTITVASSNTSMGTASGGGTYDYGASRQISASPSAHYHFVQWNDGNTNNPRTINVTADATYTAEFAIDEFTVTVSANNNYMGTVAGGGTYDYGTELQISAVPATCNRFVQWNDGNTESPRTITVVGNASYTAVFETYELTVSLSAEQIACNGGTANIINAVEGGTVPYNYAWSNGETSQNLTGVGTGTYSVTITDSNGCEATASTTITEPELLTVSVLSNDPLCLGNSTMITSSVAGGTTPYSFAWSNGESSAIISIASGGAYSLTVTDANACTAVASMDVVGYVTASISMSSDEISDGIYYYNACAGGSIEMNGIIQSGTVNSWRWYINPHNGNSSVFTTQNITYTPTDALAHDITLTAMDEHGCPAVAHGRIRVAGGLAVPTLVSPAEGGICQGSERIITIGETEGSGIQVSGSYIEALPGYKVNNDTTFLPDGTGECYSTSIDLDMFADGATVTSIDDIDRIYINMEHSYLGDISMMIRCPNGQTCLLKAHSNSSTSAITMPSLNWTNSGGINNSESIGGGTIHLGLSPDPLDSTSFCYYTIGEGYSYNFTPTATLPFGSSGPETSTPYRDQCGNTETIRVLNEGDYATYESMSSLIGCPLNGTWTIYVCDHLTQDNGYIFEWGLFFREDLYTATWGYDVYAVSTLVESNSIGASDFSNANGAGLMIAPPTNLSGEQHVNINVVDNWGCITSTPIEVDFDVMEPFDATITGNTNVCNGAGTTLTAVTDGGVSPFTYNWNTEETTASISPVNITGTVNYNVSVIDASGCTGTAETDIVWVEAPEIAMNGYSEIIDNKYYYDVCLGSSVNLSGIIQSGSADSWRWYINPHNGTSSVYTTQNITYTPTDAFAHDITLTAMDEHGCPVVAHGRIRVSGGLETSVTDYALGEICVGDSRQITIGSAGSDIQVNSESHTIETYLGHEETTFIPDGPNCTEQCYESSVIIDDFDEGATITSVDDINYVKMNMEHSFIGDLQLKITCPNGQSAIMLQDYYSSDSGRDLFSSNAIDPYTYTWPAMIMTTRWRVGTTTTSWYTGLYMLGRDGVYENPNEAYLNTNDGYNYYLASFESAADANDFINNYLSHYYSGRDYTVYNITHTSTNTYLYSVIGYTTSDDEGDHTYFVWLSIDETMAANAFSFPTQEAAQYFLTNVCGENGVISSYQETGSYHRIFFGEPDLYDVGGVNNLTSAEICDGNNEYNIHGVGYDYAWTSNSQYTTVGYVYDLVNLSNPSAAYNNGVDSTSNLYHVLPSNIETGTQMYQPFQSFSNLIGCPLNGTWTISVCDSWAQDNGYVFDWEIALSEDFSASNWDYTVDLDGVSNDCGSIATVSGNNLIVAPQTSSNGEQICNIILSDNLGCTTNIPLTYTAVAPTITHVSGDEAQTVCEGQPITDIVYTIGGVSENATASGLPDGVTMIVSENTVTISGTPTTYNTYSYTITTVSQTELGCTEQTVTGSINVSPQPTINFISVDNPNCNGDEVILEPTIENGILPYNYAWGNGETTASITVTPSVSTTYTLAVIDNNGCTASVFKEIYVPENLIVSISSTTEISCNSGTTDIANTVSGGTTPYNYAWSNGATTQNLSDVNAGAYSVTVTDNNGCTASADITISQPTELTVSLSAETIQYNGGTTDIYNMVTGGSSPYTFTWSNGEITQNLEGIGAGFYDVTVSDINGCSTTTSITITEPELFTIVVSSANETLGTVSGGGTYDEGSEITISATPAEHHHFIQWNDGNNDNPRTVTVTEDATYTAEFAIDQHTITVISANTTMGSVSGNGTYDYGTETSIIATANENYRFLSWNDNNTDNPRSVTITEDVMYIAMFENDNDPYPIYVNITDTACGSYTWNDTTYTQSGTYYQTFTASTYADSIVRLDLVIYSLPQPEITVDGILDACNPETASVILHTGEYNSYIWSNSATTESVTITTPGEYFVEVVDSHGCHGYSEMAAVGYSSTLTVAPQIKYVGLRYNGTNSYNIVQWMMDPADTVGVRGFEIYRENTEAGVYTLEQRITKPRQRSWTDPTADLTARAYRYKVCAIDECGGISPMSEPHKTMHLTINRGVGTKWNLIWSHYEGISFSTYEIYRGTSSSNMVKIAEMPSNLNSFTDNTNTLEEGMYYQIKTTGNSGAKNEEIELYSNIVANEFIENYTITALSNNVNYGAVAGSGTYPAYLAITLMAIPNDGYEFVSWNDGNTENPRIITVNEDATYIATFAESIPAATYTITAISANPAQGSVTGGGIYPEGAVVEIEAIANDGYVFASWTDGDTNNPRTITVTENAVYVAMFSEIPPVATYTITAISANPAQGTVTGGGIYPEGAVVEIEAIANDGYVFASWTDGDTNNPRTITVTENAVYVAMFTEIPPAATYTITAVSANPSQGTVTGGGSYPEGTEITIEAIAAEGYEFISWDDNNTDNPRIITVTADAMFIASFAPATDIEESATTEINVFPNPAIDILNITSSETISEIEIINVMGQIVKRVEVNSDNVACDVENLISGMYVVRIYSQNGDTSQRKFIKK